MKEKKLLTASEQQLMLNLWSQPGKGAFTRDILNHFSEPKPAYTTIATFLKILTIKGFVKSEKLSGMLYYIPRISKEDYCKDMLSRVQRDFFESNPVELIRFLAEHNSLTPEQKQELSRIFE